MERRSFSAGIFVDKAVAPPLQVIPKGRDAPAKAAHKFFKWYARANKAEIEKQVAQIMSNKIKE